MSDPYDNSPPDALEQIFQGPLNWVNLSIIGLNIVIFAVMEMTGSTEDVNFMLKWGAAYTPWILKGEWYRLFTSMFLHFGISHLISNMVLLLFMGDMLEGLVGKWRYLLIFLGGGLAGNLLSLFMDVRTGQEIVSAGASGAVYAIIGGMLVLLIRHRGRIQQMTASRLLLMAVLTIYYGFQSSGIDNAAHVGGLAGGILLTFFLYRKKT